MPFPWKKKKVARISNFVADLQSPKRGASLVVQTGFPTSLIDLFVKNRSRFKKPKLKKRLPREIPDPPPPDPAELSDGSSSDRTLPRAEPRHPEPSSSERVVGNGDHEVTDSDQDLLGVGECVGGSDSDPNKVIAAISKMLVVLVVTLSVKKLTLGITISAFVLLFLEFAGKHVVSWLCSDSTMAFQCFAQRDSSSDWSHNLVSVISKGKNHEFREKIEVELSCVEEIEILEPIHKTQEIRFIGSELNSVQEDKKWVVAEIEETWEMSEDKPKSKRGAKFKSKIVKRLVPKKLRGGSKKEKRIKAREEEIEKRGREKDAESCSEVQSSVEGDESGISEIEEMGREGIEEEEEEQDNGNKLECIEDDEVDYGITCSNQEYERISLDGGGNSESEALMLFLVALTGLIVGRFIAFLLAVTWMFTVKRLKSRGRSVNVIST